MSTHKKIDRIIELIPIIMLLTAVIWILAVMICGMARGEEHTDARIANAIWKAEGGNKATYLYGIRSVSYKDEADARRICLRTIANNRKRYADYGYRQYDTYLEFLQSRYCPVNCDNDRGTNRFWLKNVLYFLERN